jgi:hypothetical protein
VKPTTISDEYIHLDNQVFPNQQKENIQNVLILLLGSITQS